MGCSRRGAKAGAAFTPNLALPSALALGAFQSIPDATPSLLGGHPMEIHVLQRRGGTEADGFRRLTHERIKRPLLSHRLRKARE
jgi:hypothetical protein